MLDLGDEVPDYFIILRLIFPLFDYFAQAFQKRFHGGLAPNQSCQGVSQLMGDSGVNHGAQLFLRFGLITNHLVRDIDELNHNIILLIFQSFVKLYF